MKVHLLLAFAVMSMLPFTARTAETDSADAKVETVVFVGRLVSIEELPDPCEGDEDCISIDALYRARYEVVRPIVGSFAQRQVTIDIADHYGFPPFARYQHALLVVGLHDARPWLHKYQGIAVHRTVEGEWASCGEVEFKDKGEAPSAHIKPLRFEREIAGIGDLSEAGWRETLFGWRTARDQLDHRIEGGKVWCTRGVELPDIYETMRSGALRARGVALPAWSDAVGAHSSEKRRKRGAEVVKPNHYERSQVHSLPELP